MSLPDFMSGPTARPADGPDAPLQNSQPSSTKHGGRYRPLMLLLGIAGVASFVAAGAAVVIHTRSQSAVGSAASLPATVPPGDPRYRAACLDSSGSVDGDRRLGRRAAVSVDRALRGQGNVADSGVTWKASSPSTPLDIRIRIVRANSYQSVDNDGFTATLVLPGIPGVSAGKPLDNGSPDFTTRLAAWVDATEARKKVQYERDHLLAGGLKRVSQVTAQRSNGSDVLGCMAAVLGTMPETGDRSVLVVSDLADVVPVNRSGGPAKEAALAGVQVHVVQACPSGDPAGCAKAFDRFAAQVSLMGLRREDVHTSPADLLDQTVGSWLT
ncbi:MAG: hypothetical protein IPJ14_13860 [Kineosporiaceae bacterium]|nr:hypothetical protein [Kineosporiaceae bacterium]MBK8078054.1 hypothetical protein [Kineosporiaceae bacterium]